MGGWAGRQAGRGEPRVPSPVRVQSLLPVSFTLLYQHTTASRRDHHMDTSLGGHRQTVGQTVATVEINKLTDGPIGCVVANAKGVSQTVSK